MKNKYHSIIIHIEDDTLEKLERAIVCKLAVDNFGYMFDEAVIATIVSAIYKGKNEVIIRAKDDKAK